MTQSTLGDLRHPALKALRSLWRAAPLPPAARGVAGRTVAAVIGARHRRSRLEGLGVDLKRGPIVVSGFHNEALGIGRGGRLTAQALEDAGYQVIRHDARAAIQTPGFANVALPGEGGVWLQHCNAPEAIALFDRVRREDLFGRYRIGYWAWELPTAPKDWLRTARFFDEIWTPSQFTADSLAGCGVPVRAMPHPLPDVTADPDPARFEFLPGRINFLAMADLRSSAARKNPLGAVEAFLRAFPEPQAKAALTLKLVQSQTDAAAMRALGARISGRPDIRLLVEEYDADDVLRLLASADVVLSLHRAEGFGLVPAEALSLGRAALATGWSGNMEFMADLPEALVPYSLIKAQDSSGRYRRQMWADPDLDAAAAQIRLLTEDAALRAHIGRKGREAVATLRRAWSRDALKVLPIDGCAARTRD
ncbi:glycosyltransferase [Caulobacter sp. NIBR2454]|uniref:glycosyltransferase n=1 Tax=Caulobacter sp. NIBR2454 TaxID=3015996 RepID=UPI0022B750E8|nr:glycosyltransferase [Caulobacter sp. NIBR2454]